MPPAGQGQSLRVFWDRTSPDTPPPNHHHHHHQQERCQVFNDANRLQQKRQSQLIGRIPSSHFLFVSSCLCKHFTSSSFMENGDCINARQVLKLQSNYVGRAAVGGGRPQIRCPSRACPQVPSRLLHRRSGMITSARFIPVWGVLGARCGAGLIFLQQRWETQAQLGFMSFYWQINICRDLLLFLDGTLLPAIY